MQNIPSRLRIASVAAAAITLLSACDHAPTTVAESSVAFDFTNGPLQAGPFVARIPNGPVFYFSADEGRDLLSIHFPLDVFFCGGGAAQNFANIELVTTPSEVQRVIALLKDEDGAVAVYGTSDFTEAFGPGGPFSDIPHLCAFMNGPKLLAAGTARRRSVFTTTSFSGNWTGTLMDSDGNSVQYAEHHVWVADPHTGVQTVVSSDIVLH